MHTSPYVAVRPDPGAHAKSILPLLIIELTERCNNNCIHCCINLPENDVKAKRKELPAKEIKRIISEAVSLDCRMVWFTGGEPLLRKDFRELYLFARRLGLRVLIFTNATLITPAMAALFKKVPPLAPIEVSMYGMKKRSYEAVTRVPGSYEAAWRGIHVLLRNKVLFSVKSALLPPNKDEVKEWEAWAGANVPRQGVGWLYAMFLDLRCRRDDKAKNALIGSLRISPDEAMRFLSRTRANYVKGMKAFCSKFMGPAGDRLFACGSGHGGCVDAYGFFQPCMLVRHPDCVYDLKKGSLRDALGNFFPKLREKRAVGQEYLKRCARCFLKGLCEQCPGKSWSEHGTLDTPVEYLCSVAHRQARFLGLIGRHERAWEVKEWRKRIERFAGEAGRKQGA